MISRNGQPRTGALQDVGALSDADAHDFVITMLQVIPALLLAQFLIENTASRTPRRILDELDGIRARLHSGPYGRKITNKVTLERLRAREISLEERATRAQLTEIGAAATQLWGLGVGGLAFSVSVLGALGFIPPQPAAYGSGIIVTLQLSILALFATSRQISSMTLKAPRLVRWVICIVILATLLSSAFYIIVDVLPWNGAPPAVTPPPMSAPTD